MQEARAAEYRRLNLSSGKRIFRRTFPGIDQAVAWLEDNPECYIELLIECDDYISAADRKRLYDAHSGITAVIPVSRGSSGEDSSQSHSAPDLQDSMEDLFISFFRYAKGIEPDSELLDLFREVAAAEDACEA